MILKADIKYKSNNHLGALKGNLILALIVGYDMLNETNGSQPSAVICGFVA